MVPAVSGRFLQKTIKEIGLLEFEKTLLVFVCFYSADASARARRFLQKATKGTKMFSDGTEGKHNFY